MRTEDEPLLLVIHYIQNQSHIPQLVLTRAGNEPSRRFHNHGEVKLGCRLEDLKEQALWLA